MATLDKQHLSDLHRLAAELGIERYRMLPREELIAAITERDPDASVPEPEPVDRDRGREERAERSPRRRRERSGRRPGGRDEGPGGDGEDESDVEGEPVSGVLDITPRGHGFIRLSGLESAEEDVYVSPSQIRRCELQRGDEIAGPARKPRR